MEEEQLQIQKEKIMGFIQREDYLPLKRTELAILLSVPSDDRLCFEELIDQLKQEGRLCETKKGKLMTPEQLNLISGTFLSHGKGFGFVKTDASTEDIFIPASQVNGAMHKDVVLCKIVAGSLDGKRAEGEIVQILKRGMHQLVGTFEKRQTFGFVIPDDKKVAQDIFIPQWNTMGAVSGTKVVVTITKSPEGQKNPEGKIIELLGHKDDPGVDILSIIRQYELPVAFPPEVTKELSYIPDEVTDLDGREDFRGRLTITIDGEDAKDLDDAVSLRKLENGNYELGVHIADVSHYVKEYSALDKEAYLRGTSVYLVDRVIPMLPHQLSNGICSLNPDVDRLTLSCVMEIDHTGQVVGHNVCNSVIHSDARMTYTTVRNIVEDGDLEASNPLITPMILEMAELRNILLKKRKKRGSVNFELPESKIIVDPMGKPLEILPADRNTATSMIEEFMLVCNETIAQDYFWQEIPFLYRNHETPNDEKIQKMKTFIGSFGFRLKGTGELHPKAIQQILEEAEGKPSQHIVSRIILRSMKQAKYMAENLGHFGLAAPYYCHFTSPIRRYPDLQIHRIIKENLSGLKETRRRHFEKIIPTVASQCSKRERVAEDAERETEDVKKVEYMEDKIGQQFEGIISGLSGRGIYVELPNTVEGMVAVTQFTDDTYFFQEESMSLIGQRTHRKYQLGDPVTVKLLAANRTLKEIDFKLVTEDESTAKHEPH